MFQSLMIINKASLIYLIGIYISSIHGDASLISFTNLQANDERRAHNWFPKLLLSC